jgi:hypothetical protein
MLLSSRPRRLAVVPGLCAGIGAGATAGVLALTDTGTHSSDRTVGVYTFAASAGAADEAMDATRRHGPFEPHRLILDEVEYTTKPALAEWLADRWESIERAIPVVVP